MSRNILKDKHGRVIGEITVKSDGTMELRDRHGRYLGKYDPKRNETKDKLGRLVGKGNLLIMLLEKDMAD